MRFIEYEYHDVGENRWIFDRVTFQAVNLLVGNSATGKTRLLNTLVNGCRFVSGNDYKNGCWNTTFEESNIIYRWNLETNVADNSEQPGAIVRESLSFKKDDEWIAIFDRDETRFTFQQDILPKLSPTESGIHILKEEELIKPVYKGFESILRRDFSHDALSKASEYQVISPKLLDEMAKRSDIRKLLKANMNLNANLFILSEYFSASYRELIENFREIFPFIQEVRLSELSRERPSFGLSANVPVFAFRERNSQDWIMLNEMSSGMKKVLLILTDIFLLPEHSIYVIDEYENSLGLNAIDFFPEFLLTLEKKIQFLITSHHPYIINELPLNNWFIFHRNGSHVTIKYGDEVETLFGHSRQQAFIQLINEPFFAQGVE